MIAFLLLPPGVGHAADDDKIWDAVFEISRAYETLEYERAFALIQGARRLPRDVEGEVTLSLYEGILLCEMGHLEPARAAFRQALLMRPDVDLPEDVAPKVEKYFEDTRRAVAQERVHPPAPSAPSRVEEPSAQEAPVAPVQADPPVATSQQPKAEVDMTADGAALLKRLARLSEQTPGSDSVSTLGALQQLSAIGRQIKAASDPAALQEASSAMDSWEERYLRSAQSTP